MFIQENPESGKKEDKLPLINLSECTAVVPSRFAASRRVANMDLHLVEKLPELKNTLSFDD